MTSAPVKDVNSVMNFVRENNSSKTGDASAAGSFGDLMSKTQGNLAGGQKQLLAAGSAGKTQTADLLKTRTDTGKVSQPANQAKNDRQVKETKPAEVTDDKAAAVQDAGKEVVKKVADELGVTEEEVEQAMEELGLSAYSLFEPSNMTQLVLQLTGEDAAALLTDENLLASLQELIDGAAGIMSELAGEMDLSPEDMSALLEEVQKRLAGQVEKPEEAQKQPLITVEVNEGDDTVTLAADEDGNTVKTLDVVSAKENENPAENQSGEQEKKGSENKEHEGVLHAGSNLSDMAMQNNTQTAEVSFEEAGPHFNEQTQDIMNQILDHMRLQLRPGMDQLEMQLHPESLGTVQIQLISRGGEVTAHFQVQNEAVKAALESQISTLQENLKEQGVKVEAVQVTVESHGFESNLWQGQERNDSASAENESGKKTPRRINLNELDVEGMLEEDASEEEVLAARMMEANGSTVDYTV
ncbi:MAG: flagellar hook-length control protein FliK [Clostridium sp.]|nr:flagellar hook-length control protein FliK [Clostridium sp.]